MADVRSSKASGEREQQMQRRGEEGGRMLARRRELFPWPTPSEFFSTSPFTLMRRLTEDMDRAFASLTGRGRETPSLWMPPIEVLQLDNKIKVCAELPGLNKDDVKVEVTENELVIQGERKREEEEKGEGYYHSERSYGQFYRSIPLPEGAKLDEAQAEFRNGVLEVTIPVPESAQKGRQIPVRSAEEPQGAKKTQAA